MNRVIKTLVSTFGATILLASTAMPAFATYTTPDAGDLNYGLVNTVLEVTKITVLPVLLNKDNIKIVYIEDLLDASKVIEIKNSLNNVVSQNNILVLQNALNLKNVLNGLSILSFSNFLNNNNANLKDVIAVNVFENGQVLVFCCH